MGLFSEKDHAGFYLDNQILCVVNTELKSSSSKIIGFYEGGVENFIDGTVEMKQKLLESIRLAFKKANVKSKNISLAIPGNGSMIRYFELPFLTKKEERSAVRFEAQKYVPFDMKDLYFDYETYPDAARKKVGVVFFACKKKWVDSLTSILQLLDTKIQRVELASQAIARAFSRNYPKTAEKACAILCSSSSETAEFLIEKNGSVLTTQHLSIPTALNASQSDITSLVSDIRISMDYFAENFKKFKVDEFFIATPFSFGPENISDIFKKEFSVSVSKSNLIDSSFRYTSTAAASASFGLTLASLESKKKTRINLKGVEASLSQPTQALTWDEEKKKLNNLAVSEILGIIVFFAVIHFLFTGKINSNRASLDRIIGQYPKAETASLSESPEQLRSKEILIQDKISFYSEAIDKRTFLTSKLNALTKVTPENILLTKLSYADELGLKGTPNTALKLEGVVVSAEAGAELTVINKFVAQLTSSQEFASGLSEIKITSTQRATFMGQPSTKFVLDCASSKKGSA